MARNDSTLTRPTGKNALALGMALQIQEAVETRLERIETEVRLAREFLMNRHHYSLPVGGTAGVDTTEKEFAEMIPQGYIFTGQRLVASAPEGSKLQIFRDKNTPLNMIEVAANIQEYADGILGPMVVEGPARLIAVISGAKVEGAFAIILSGELVLKATRQLIR